MRSNESQVVILGAGGHGSEVYAYIQDLIRGGWAGKCLGFLDDSLPKGEHQGLPILGSLDQFLAESGVNPADIMYFTALGSNPVRRKVVARVECTAPALRAWTLIHRSAFVGNSEIGEGTLLAPGTIVTARTKIGRHCILNVKASVSHDCMVGDYVNINPGVTIAGHCRIGDSAYIGAGATVIDRIKIGENAIIGAGAAVVRDIPPNCTAVGVPARVIKNH